ncbi:MAG: hypothetical protein HY996_10580 [Micrococcales bacterium]|nr:hypothetical protein [Micrococcales bacterium]
MIPGAKGRRASGSRTPFGGALIGATLVVAALAGCTGPKPDPTPTPKPSKTTAAAQAPGITNVTNAPGSGAGLVGALADSTVKTCELSGDAWKVAGTVKNPTQAAAAYRIYVSLLDAKGGTRALQEVDVDAMAGTTEDWSADIRTAEKGLSCVLRVERYAAK